MNKYLDKDYKNTNKDRDAWFAAFKRIFGGCHCNSGGDTKMSAPGVAHPRHATAHFIDNTIFSQRL